MNNDKKIYINFSMWGKGGGGNMNDYLISYGYDINYLAILEFWDFRCSHFNQTRDGVEKIVQRDVE